MKLYVEITDEEYETLKQIRNGEHFTQEEKTHLTTEEVGKQIDNITFEDVLSRDGFVLKAKEEKKLYDEPGKLHFYMYEKVDKEKDKFLRLSIYLKEV